MPEPAVKTDLKLIFAGTPEFAAVALRALLDAGHQVSLVLTQPDRPAGRGLRLDASPVKRVAEARGIALAQPQTLKNRAIARQLEALTADVMVVAAYGLILPRPILEIPRLGCLNIHASLLPRWRGAAPIQRAILAGDAETGITIMQMNEGLDTGGILLQQAMPIAAEDNAGFLHDGLAVLGGELIVKALAQPLQPQPQDETLATYAAKIDKREARIDWAQSAQQIGRQIRAYNPYPGAVTRMDGVDIKVWRSQPVAHADEQPGTVIEVGRGRLLVACGEGALDILELQRAGSKRLPVAMFLGGFPVARGKRLGQ